MAKYLFMIKPSTYAACSVFSLVKFVDRCREMFHASKIRIHLHPSYKSRLSHWEVTHNMLSPSTQNFVNSYTKGCYISTKYKCQYLTLRIVHSYTFLAFIIIKLSFVFIRIIGMGYIYIKLIYYEKKPKGQNGENSYPSKKMFYSPYPLKFFISFQKRVLMQGMLQ